MLGRKRAGPDVGHVGVERGANRAGQIDVRLDEARLGPAIRPSRSCQTSTWPEQDLPAPMPNVGMPTASVMRAATGGGIASSTRRETAGALERLRFVDEPAPRSRRPPLCLVAAEQGRRLWRQPDMAHDRNAGVDESAPIRERVRPAPSSFTASAPLSLTNRMAFSTADDFGHLIRTQRHVGDDQCPPGRRGPPPA